MQPNPTAATTTTTHTAYIWHSLGTGCDTSCLTLRVKPTQRVPCQPRWIPEQTPPTLPWVSRSLLSLARRASASLSESKPPARTTQDAPKFPRTRGSHHCLHHHRSHHLPPATTIRRSKQYKRSDVEMRQRNPAGPNIAHRATSRRTAYCVCISCTRTRQKRPALAVAHFLPSRPVSALIRRLVWALAARPSDAVVNGVIQARDKQSRPAFHAVAVETHGAGR